MDPFLRLEDVAHDLGGRRVLDGINLEIRQGEIFSLLGPSGCGKTTLLRLLAGFLTPDRGRLLLEGRDLAALPPERRPINTVFQNYALFPHLTVARNIAFGLECEGLPRHEIQRRIDHLLDLVRLEDCADRRPGELSGGQKQRVALARALVKKPAVLLLDEPLAALDWQLRQALLEELHHLQRQLGTTFIYVTHDQNEALRLSDRMAVMNAGRLAQVDTPQALYDQPADLFVARFIGDGTLLPARCHGTHPDGTLDLEIAGGPRLRAVAPRPLSASAGQTCHVLLRPERLRLVSEPVPADLTPGLNECTGRLTALRPQGPHTRAEIRLHDSLWLANLAQVNGQAPPLTVGDTVRALIDPADLRVLL